MNDRRYSGFTLIELLIVVAIIAILAAIAVPNFLEAQVRAKVSRAKSDLRTLATSIETYKIDNTKYPLHMLVDQLTTSNYDPWLGSGSLGTNEFHFSRKFSLTTPVAYISTIPHDVFYKFGAPVNPGSNQAAIGAYPARKQYLYSNSTYGGSPATVADFMLSYGEWRTWTGGPDTFRRDIYLRKDQDPKDSMRIYDATNGTLSVGDIWRTQKNVDGSRPIVPGVVD